MSSTQNDSVNVYCDESCHLEHDGKPIMALGAIWCPYVAVRRLSDRISGLKTDYSATGELKWGKVSRSRIEFYRKLIDVFIDDPDLHFRGLVVRNKSSLNHAAFNQGSHDLFYYKMYFRLLSPILNPANNYRIYLDIKDTRSRRRVHKLKEVLCYDRLDFAGEMIPNLQNIRSHESHLMQMADFLSGALSYKHRHALGALSEPVSAERLGLVAYLERKTGVDWSRTTPFSASKVNLFVFTPRVGA